MPMGLLRGLMRRAITHGKPVGLKNVQRGQAPKSRLGKLLDNVRSFKDTLHKTVDPRGFKEKRLKEQERTKIEASIDQHPEMTEPEELEAQNMQAKQKKFVDSFFSQFSIYTKKGHFSVAPKLKGKMNDLAGFFFYIREEILKKIKDPKERKLIENMGHSELVKILVKAGKKYGKNTGPEHVIKEMVKHFADRKISGASRALLTMKQPGSEMEVINGKPRMIKDPMEQVAISLINSVWQQMEQQGKQKSEASYEKAG